MLILSVMLVLSFASYANEQEERELGIQLIEIESIPMADEQIKLKLPDYNQDTLAKEIEINEQYHHNNLKYDFRGIKTDL